MFEVIWDASVQEINYQKSYITFGVKMETNLRHLICLFMGIPKENEVLECTWDFQNASSDKK